MKSPSPVPERILVCGHTGSGKTETYIATAAHCRTTGDDAKFRVVNADMPGTIERCNERHPSWRDNIDVIDTRDWDSFSAATEAYRSLSQPGDWLIIDGLDRAWVWIRDEFLRRKARAAGKSESTDLFGSLDIEITGSEYGDRVNPAYDRWLFPLLDPETNPAHLLMTCPTQPVVVEGLYKDDPAIIAEYGQYGVRPMGQKLNGFRVHSVLLARHERKQYTLSTMGKDRGRANLDNVVITPEMGFVQMYLGAVAGFAL